ncbi:MAG: cytochrome c family protein, partial [Gammaproteobacteria bacterium]|nr:cytochrome c family protein [Gammaproteobacteria bacterium]
MSRRRHTLALATTAVVTWLLGAGALAEPVDDKVHLGVASCATGVCHGKLTEQEDGNVWLNEYRIWSADDRHARAYQTLLTAESKAIARKLGLPNAQGAKICLDCHADNVPQGQRGKKFQLSDGVGCEACHGGAENWIESHTEDGIRHQDNLAAGMLGTEDINTRAEVCLSCHLGTSNQFATHRIMGAGHPRLAFELEAYTYNQPAHYAVDEDYLARKGAPSGFAIWRAGQLETTRRYLQLLQSDLFAAEAALPDFSFYDCHSCHHSMDDVRWPDFRRQQGLEPGGLRLQDQHLFMLRAVTGVLAP